MARRITVLFALTAILLGSATAGAVKRRIAALPQKVVVAEEFNVCVERPSARLGHCCYEAREVCEDECSRIQTLSTNRDQAIRCEAACDDAAVWCRRGVGQL